MIETQIQMRFADIDVLGHVNNVNQQHYFDLGKCDFYKQVLGLTPYWKTAGLIIVASQTNPPRRADLRTHPNHPGG